MYSLTQPNTSTSMVFQGKMELFASENLVSNANKIIGIDALGNLTAHDLVPFSNLGSYVDDVVEYPTYAAFSGLIGQTGKIYIATDTNASYRWTGSQYILISSFTPIFSTLNVTGASALDTLSLSTMTASGNINCNSMYATGDITIGNNAGFGMNGGTYMLTCVSNVPTMQQNLNMNSKNILSCGTIACGNISTGIITTNNNGINIGSGTLTGTGLITGSEIRTSGNIWIPGVIARGFGDICIDFSTANLVNIVEPMVTTNINVNNNSIENVANFNGKSCTDYKPLKRYTSTVTGDGSTIYALSVDIASGESVYSMMITFNGTLQTTYMPTISGQNISCTASFPTGTWLLTVAAA